MEDNKNKKDSKLITRQQVIFISLAASLGVGLYVYRAVREKGFFDITILLSTLLSLIIIGAVIFTLVWWANKPRKED